MSIQEHDDAVTGPGTPLASGAEVTGAAAPLPFDAAYAAIHARDARFDGQFYTAVLSTKIYCRPSCPAPTPKPQNVRFVRTAAEAQGLGLRPCLRCFPEALPGTPQWAPRTELARRALELIAGGGLDEASLDTLARRLHTSPRTLHRVMVEETGAPPVAHARAHRARTAFRLLASTDLSNTEVAWAAGFGSVRQFNDTVKQVFDRTPSQLREAARRSPRITAPGVPAALSARLEARDPVDVAGLLAWFGARTLPGVDEVSGSRYRVAVRLPRGTGTVSVGLDADERLRASLVLDDAADLTAAVRVARHLFDLDADTPTIDAALGQLPWLRDAVNARPGARIPGEPTLTESLCRAIATQQVSVAAGRGQLRRLVEAANGPADTAAPDAGDAEPLAAAAAVPAASAGTQPAEPQASRASGGSGAEGEPAPSGTGLTPFPTAETALETLDAWFRGPAARRETFERVLTLLADAGEPTDRDGASALLERVGALKGIGPWTLAYARLRTVGDPDVDLSGDGALLSRARTLGLAEDKRRLTTLLDGARPWRSYAALHLWG
ncbi:DNA-3-methyladenine glycosylase 2 family protein [Galactobacter valiniphilus]|uniref:DNA-3-methyladenine glycosylase 2 family protein n=1 Tax=Galactobacter valiniphilus TaxID=2676122 RepID=A0A399JCK1_9MICC|nr:Ada metal-binding domain-containing protein [Galactobacter valiniphilus]RII43275.1 DNA-3-methyladenine glycosylase 2 family protein [Galactobacter valiniphilus]